MHHYCILIAERSPSMRTLLRTTLRRAGYRVVVASTGSEALHLFEHHRIHLLIVAWHLPDIGGATFCEYVRSHSLVPLVVLSSHDQREQKVKAFEAGADDYILRPICPDELLMRVRALLRRAYRHEQRPRMPDVWQCGDIEIDFARRCLRRNGQEISLTRIEWALLNELVRNAGRVLTHEELLRRVWGESYGNEKEYLRVYMGRLRRKLGDDPKKPRYLVTHHSVGYQFVG